MIGNGKNKKSMAYVRNVAAFIKDQLEMSKEGYYVFNYVDKPDLTMNELINLINGEETIYKDLAIKSMKCTNSEFDDNPEIKAYIQVRDLTKKNNDEVYVFNNWMFSSSPSIIPFDHPVYDIWLTDCN